MQFVNTLQAVVPVYRYIVASKCVLLTRWRHFDCSCLSERSATEFKVRQLTEVIKPNDGDFPTRKRC